MSRRVVPRAFLAGAILLSTGCGYFMAGTWEDDPGNWGRAFQSTKPPDVTVVHSKYWRSPHFTLEFQYFFEIAPNRALKDQLFTQNALRQLSSADSRKRLEDVTSDAPKWFVPQPADSYDVWVYADQRRESPGFTVLIDRATGEMFLTDTLR